MSEDGENLAAGGARPIARALLSTADKTGLTEFAALLAGAGAELISTGGTAAALRSAGLAVTDVAEVTGAPEMLDGRVKTLHPAVHGALLARRDRSDHMSALATQGYAPIDLLVANLYPFEQTVDAGAAFDACVEQIDIGGPAMLRAAAKNAADVAVVCAPSQYAALAAEISAHRGTLSATRRRLAAQAFAHVAAYDAAIARYLAAADADPSPPERLTLSAPRIASLRYGENPHQQAALYGLPSEGHAAARAQQLHGKPLSYNNILDADAAFELAAELDGFGAPAVVVVKHTNPCGAALRPSVAEAYARARAADPVSAFGGVVASSRPIDADAARAIAEIFTEVVVAPAFADDALGILCAKRDIRLLATGGLPGAGSARLRLRSVRGALLAQEADQGALALDGLERAQDCRPPTEREMIDLRFAWIVAKHVKSNAIVLARDTAVAGVGAGQMSRLDSMRIAVQKARDAEATASGPLAPFVVGSDAFFPFADAVEAAAEAGAVAVIQPGGSIRDAEVIGAARARGLAMVLTGMRHFRH